MVNVLKTTNFDKFKFFEHNRQLNIISLHELTIAIEKENVLFAHPIIVTSDFHVIDGQHRLAAARALNKSIYYIVSDDISDLHIMKANINQRRWNMKDVIKYYATAERKETYIKFNHLLNDLDLLPRGLIGLLIGTKNPSIFTTVRTGELEIDFDDQFIVECIEVYYRLIGFVNERKVKPYVMFKSYSFTASLRKLISSKRFETCEFFNQLEETWHLLKPCANPDDWYKTLKTIFNYRKRLNRIQR